MTEREILQTKVKLSLAKLGISERLRAGVYLCEIIMHIILTGDDSLNGFMVAIKNIEDKYKIANTTIMVGLGCVLKKSVIKEFFKNVPASIYKKIKLVKDWIVESL